jgi:hypothetical protein
MSLLSRILGAPLSTADRDAVFARVSQQIPRESVLEFFRSGAEHNTAKSGALLGAQGIFVVVDVFALDQSWPRAPVLAAMLVMLLGSLIVMINLRGTLGPFMSSVKRAPNDSARRTFELVLVRSIRFNVAL